MPPAERPLLSEEQVLQMTQACSNAGRWGPDDELGTLNFIEPSTRLAAMRTRLPLRRTDPSSMWVQRSLLPT